MFIKSKNCLRKITLILLLCVMMSTTMFALGGCMPERVEILETPKFVVHQADEKVTWTAISGARGYLVEAEGLTFDLDKDGNIQYSDEAKTIIKYKDEVQEFYVEGASSTETSIASLPAGTYNVKIKAVGRSPINYDSFWSSAKQFIKDEL